MPVTFQGGQSMPAFGSAAYNAIAAPSAPSGAGSYNSSTGAVSVNNAPVYTPPISQSIWTGLNGGPKPITASALAPTAPITLPTTPITPSVNTNANNAGLANPLMGITTNADGSIAYKPVTLDSTKTADQQQMESAVSNVNALLGITPRKENILSSPDILAANAGIDQQNRDIQDTIGRINTITNQQTAVRAKAEADKLSTIGQGRGIPEAIIGGQQAQIEREAAIQQFGLAQQALPLQAILAAQQGNLKLAEDHLTTLTNMKMEAATNDYNYKMAQYSSIKDFVTKQEDIQLQKLQTNETRAYNEKQANIKSQDEWSKLAVTNGTPSLVTSINALNPASPTFTADLGKITSQITPKKDLQFVPGTTNQSSGYWDKTTGKFTALGGGSGGNGGGAGGGKKVPIQYTDPRSLPENLRSSLLDDIVLNQGTPDQLYAAYPEINKSTINTLYEHFSLQGTNLNPTPTKTKTSSTYIPGLSSGSEKKNMTGSTEFSDIKNNEDLQNTINATYKAFPFTSQAHGYIDQAKIGILKDVGNKTELNKGVTALGEQTPKGADFKNFIINHVLPISKTASDFIINHTSFLQNLDKANIDIKTTDPQTLAHEMLHQVFENSPLGENNPDGSPNVNAEKFGNLFLDTWDSVAKSDQDSPLAQIDSRINSDYNTKDMAGVDLATERFAYLGELVGKYGLSVIPKELRPYYKGVFNFK